MSTEMQFTRIDDSNWFITNQQWKDISGIPQTLYKPEFWETMNKKVVVKMNGWIWHIYCVATESERILQNDGYKRGNVYVAIHENQFRWFIPRLSVRT